MTDKVIEAIKNKSLSAEMLTLEYLRDTYSNNMFEDGGRLELERGRAIIDDTNKLDQYLHTYGPMVNQQWSSAFDFTMIEGSTTLIDYACGQGLSFLNLVTKWQTDDHNKTWQDFINSIVLIEPSKVALNRAEAIIKLKFPEANIKSINKKLEELDGSETSCETNKIYIHVFSQIMDIPFEDEFNILDFFENITCNVGTHYLLVISHDTPAMNNTVQIKKLYKYIVHNYVDGDITLDIVKNSLFHNISKQAKGIALNSYQISNNKQSISMFACIETTKGS